MKQLIFILALIVAPLTLFAQSQEDTDKGYLTELIEENLSGVSREVSIIGFQGALSSQATIDVLTVSDVDGVWLTLENLVLDWNRGALLRGQIDIQELSAARVIVARAPISENTGPTAEAQPFSLPELPVGISLDRLNIDEIELGESFLGEPISVSLSGNAQLSDGEGAANVTATRLGTKSGVFAINGSYANATRVLGLILNLEEGADGIAARMLDLPGRPSVKLAIDGTAPLDNYDATLAIATDGQDRITGTFGLAASDEGNAIRLNIGGDVTPLFAPEYQEFFGNDVSLIAEGRQLADGHWDLSKLDLAAQSVRLSGAASIGKQGWPERINLTGSVKSTDGDVVLLPLAGPKTYIDSAALNIGYDTLQSPDWSAEIKVAGFDRPGLSISDMTLDGGGILIPGEGDLIGQVTANLQYAARGLQLDDAGAAEAFGDTVSGVLEASRVEGDPTQINRFTLTGPGLEALAEAKIDGPKSGFQTQSTIILTVDALNRFSTLVGRDLGGAAELTVLSAMTPLDGLYNVILTGQTQDLAIGIPQVDSVLRGSGSISANAVRDTDGTRLEALNVSTDAAQVNANADLTSKGSTAQFDASLNDIGQIVDHISGPATLLGTASQNAEGVVAFDITGTGPAAILTATGTSNPAGAGQTVNADIKANITDLSRYSRLANRPLAGTARVQLAGVLLSDGLRFDAQLDANTSDLAVGIAQLDPLLAGEATLSAGLSRPTTESFMLTDLSLTTPVMSLSGDVDYETDGIATADLDIQVSDGQKLDPSLSGPVSATVKAARGVDGITQVDLAADGPGAEVRLDASVAPPAMNYEITGELVASVANLTPYRSLVGMPVSGGVNATASGSLLPDLTRFSAKASVKTDSLGIGNPTVDQLLRGTGRLNVTAALEDGTLIVSTLEATTPNVVIVGALNGNAGQGRGRFNATLKDVGIFTDQLSGPIRTTGTASLDSDGNWGIDASGTGPGGIAARAAGIIGSAGRLDIDINGNAPLGLANAAIEPRRLSGIANFDLSVNGQPELSSVSGQISVDDGRLAAPTLAQALTNIRGGVTLNNGSAQINVQANVESGGSVSISGPVSMEAPNNANITTQVNRVILKDPELYQTSVSGTMTLSGPLQGGARIAGQFNLGQTDIQVPSSSVSSLGTLPNVTHDGANAAVRTTLERAGVIASSAQTTTKATPRRSYPLDITISAPSRIFIRGRGLDAELGGTLNIGGTTDNIIPVGRFELVRGRIDILQQRFDLTEGTASLQGDFEPYIRLVATTEARTGTTISIIVEGPATEPEVRFESTPNLPQDEVLSQLIFGRNLDSISPLQAVQLASAVSTLAGKGGGGLVDEFRQSIGLDDFDVTTTEEGAAAVRAGKYLSENIYTDVTITSEGETEINLNLDITDEITAKGTVDQAGETSVGIFFERDY